MKTFKEFAEQKLERPKHVVVRDPSGKVIPIKNVVYRGADEKLHSAPPGKSSSSAGR